MAALSVRGCYRFNEFSQKKGKMRVSVCKASVKSVYKRFAAQKNKKAEKDAKTMYDNLQAGLAIL